MELTTCTITGAEEVCVLSVEMTEFSYIGLIFLGALVSVKVVDFIKNLVLAFTAK